MNLKGIYFGKFFIFLTCLKLSDFFPRKSFVLQKFLPLNYTYGLWERLLSHNYYNSLLGATVVTSSSKRAKKKYIATADWSLQVCVSKHGFLIRRKGTIFYQNKYFNNLKTAWFLTASSPNCPLWLYIWCVWQVTQDPTTPQLHWQVFRLWKTFGLFLVSHINF